MRPTSVAWRAPTAALAGALVAAAWTCATLVVLLVATLRGPQSASQPATTAGASALAEREIPPGYLRLYLQAGSAYGIDWAILAGIGEVECDHGRDPAPSCTHEGSVNGAGAGGPMQFLASTWQRYGVDCDGDGVADRWDPADAICSAANYLRASGAPGDYARALLAYNHAAWYVRAVEAWAARYRSVQAFPDATRTSETGAQLTSTPVAFVPGERATLEPGDGHLALIPADAPTVVQAMVVAGNELQDLPYGPAGHPDPRGATQEDCSSTVNYVLYRAGVRPISEIIRDNPVAQAYVGWGVPGPGRWVTIFATDLPTPHVFIVIAGLRLDTSGGATDVGPNSGQEGPRWRVLDHIPTWARWSVRHPPGL